MYNVSQAIAQLKTMVKVWDQDEHCEGVKLIAYIYGVSPRYVLEQLEGNEDAT